MDWQSVFFHDWQGVGRTVVIGTAAYITLILFLRISGKRTLAKLNAFDLVITVALGSTLSAIMLQESLALAERATALGLLILLQFAVTFSSVRSQYIARAIRSEPTLLARNGSYCWEAMRTQRLTQTDLLGAIRAAGGREIKDVEAMFLESDGSISTQLRK